MMPLPDGVENAHPTGQDKDVFFRAFVALRVNDDVRRKLAELQTRLRATHAHVGWVSPANLHVSLVFMGDITRQQVGEVSAVLDDTAARFPPFIFQVEGVGVFGRPQSPRIVWAGVRTCPPLMTVQADLSAQIRALGIELETRPFRPHITLGRVRSPSGRQDLVRALEPMAARAFGPVHAASLSLMRSVLKPAGAEHAELHAAPFRLPAKT